MQLKVVEILKKVLSAIVKAIVVIPISSNPSEFILDIVEFLGLVFRIFLF